MTDVSTSTESSPIYYSEDFSVATKLTVCSSLSIFVDGNVTPSSDSSLGSEDEQLSNIYENIVGALNDSDVRFDSDWWAGNNSGRSYVHGS